MKLHMIICTWFGLGKSILMPGTIGSLGAFPIFYFAAMSSTSIEEAKNTMYFFIMILCIIGYFAINAFHKNTGIIDHSSIVIDEVIGQLLTLAISYEWIGNLLTKFYFTENTTYINGLIAIFLFAFVLFRFFDITKPFGISLVDNYCKNAIGVIVDDILAGIAASIVFYIIKILFI